MFSNELLLDAGDFVVFGWSSRNNADTENASDFFVKCWISVMGEFNILGGGGESTSNSDDDELERDREREWLRLLDRDLVRVTLRFDGESQTISDFAWYIPTSSSSDSGFSINRFTPNFISSVFFWGFLRGKQKKI